MNAALSSDVVIIGSGLAGYTLARELRKRDTQVTIAIVTADGGEAYAKPMLSNAFAQGKAPASLVQKPAAQVAADLGIAVHTRSFVTGIDRKAAHILVRSSDGTDATIGYGRLVLAMGADPRPYQVPGSDGVYIHTVNDLDDYAKWRDGLVTGQRILLVGGGLIGCEFANDLAVAGFQVTLVDPAGWPLGRLLPPELGAEVAKALAGAGIILHFGRSITQINADGAVLDDGTVVGFDHALSAIGLVARTKLAQAAGLAVGRGIIVDRQLTTSDPAIFAIGDCAETAAGPLPFVLPLMAEARTLAATLAGTPTDLVLPAMPVVVKIPALPCVVSPPAPGSTGTWHISGNGPDRQAMFVTDMGNAIGFALTGSFAGQRQALAKDMPAILE